MRKILAVSAVVVLTGLVAWPSYRGQVMAQAPPPGAGTGSIDVVSGIVPGPSGSLRRPFVYTVKFMCGTVAANDANPQLPANPEAPATPGTYLTEITIYNRQTPNMPVRSAQLDLLAVIATDRGAPAGPISQLTTQVVLQNQAIRLDSAGLYRLLGVFGNAASPFVSGYLSIYSDVEVDVSAVYTSST